MACYCFKMINQFRNLSNSDLLFSFSPLIMRTGVVSTNCYILSFLQCLSTLFPTLGLTMLWFFWSASSTISLVVRYFCTLGIPGPNLLFLFIFLMFISFEKLDLFFLSPEIILLSVCVILMPTFKLLHFLCSWGLNRSIRKRYILHISGEPFHHQHD